MLETYPATMSTTRQNHDRTLVLSHKIFRNLQPAMFRRAEDGTAVMVVSLGAEQAILPLAALRREFAISPDSDDGRMLAMVEQALGYVAGLVPGERLPPEVVGGASSAFVPTDAQQRRALLRVEAVLDGPVRAREVTPRAVAAAVDALAKVESLHDTLIERVALFRDHTEALARANRGESDRALAVGQVARLARVADGRLAERFEGVAAVDPERLVHAPESSLPALQAGCDVLARNRTAWAPTLDAWERLPGSAVLGDWTLLERTYRFLAPRYMSTSEWQARFIETRAAPERAAAQMIW